MTKKQISLIGVPADVGAGDRGATMGPEALRVAGIGKTLSSMGYKVKDLGNLYGPKNPELPPIEGYRHIKENVIWNQNVHDAFYTEMTEGNIPIMLGGDHALAMGSVAAVARYAKEQNRELCVLWLDAHSDYNTCESSPSGNVHGMPVATITGNGHPDLMAIGHAIPMVKPENVFQVGIRSVDIAEKKLVLKSGIIVYDMRRIDEIGMHQTMKEILEQVKKKNALLHISFDVDGLDPTIAPGVGTTIPGGITYREAQLFMEMAHDSGLVSSMDIVEINPALDNKNITAEIAVDLTASLFGRHIFPLKTPL